MPKGNREYKSDVFSMLLEDKWNALQVYNAVNGSDYKNPELVEICTLEGGISLSIRNDASFIFDAVLSIYEHQSTVCPNMPTRFLIYYVSVITERIEGKDLYGGKVLKLPMPSFVVFYNGTQSQPESYEMRLSELYERRSEKPDLELVCRFYNINRGKNEALLSRCPVLKEYMVFVDYVREYNRRYEEEGSPDLEKAIESAMARCIKENVLKEFFLERGAEVLKMKTLDYTFERRLALQKEESRQEGWNEGRDSGLSEGLEQGANGIISMGKRCKLSAEDILQTLVEELQISRTQAQDYYQTYHESK